MAWMGNVTHTAPQIFFKRIWRQLYRSDFLVKVAHPKIIAIVRQKSLRDHDGCGSPGVFGRKIAGVPR